MSDFDSLDLKLKYAGTNTVLTEFVLPVLERAVSYDRLSGYFNSSALLAISAGLEKLWHRRGKMRLVLGLHDLSPDIIEAHLDARDLSNQHIQEFEKRLLSEVSTLESELERDRIAALAWMIRAGLLEIKAARPIGGDPRHIFHSKCLIFSDSLGNVVAATGSPNETRPGQQGNYEDVTVFMSWQSKHYTDIEVEHFSSVWTNQAPELDVQPISQDFAAKLLEAMNWPESRTPALFVGADALAGLFNHLREAPYLAHLSYPAVRLFPHQERALLDSLNRDSIRVLLADEVGLGKTLEAGALISHAIKYGGVKSVCILAPASIIRQFQDELYSFFDLDFYVWDSGARQYQDTEKRPFRGKKFQSAFASGTPELKIISSQLARGSSGTSSIFTGLGALPDMLVVDEAHAARIHPDNNGVKPTRLWKTLNEVAGKIQHLVLMTATPLQVQPLEFHGLLALLGLPSAWQSRPNYLRSLEFMGGAPARPALQDAFLLSKLLSPLLEFARFEKQGLDESQISHIEKWQGKAAESSNAASIYVLGHWKDFVGILLRLHPASFLVIRNTRSGLKDLGYKFPERKFEAPKVVVGAEMALFFSKLEDYLDNHFGMVEAAANPRGSAGLGFARSGYQQRLASSVAAAHSTLERRLNKIEALESGSAGASEIDVDYLDEDDEAPFYQEDSSDSARLNQQAISAAALIEKASIKDLLALLRAIPGGLTTGDPKFKLAAGQISETIGEDKILVFSRYTDTLRAFVEHFKTNYAEIASRGFGLYTGEESWIELSGVRESVSKRELKVALDKGLIRLVICSDAASEGLNLQSARRLINIDVPWNPARLEQRIGRVARLGQKAPDVSITNLWYPDSVEALMYSRLLERRDLYELAVGEFPDIVSRAIKNHASVQGNLAGSQVDLEAMQELESARNSAQSRALHRVWDVNRFSRSRSDDLFKRLDAIIEPSLGLTGTSVPPLTLGNLAVENLRRSSARTEAGVSRLPLYAATSQGATWGFLLERASDWLVVKSSAVPQLIAAALGDVALSADQLWGSFATQSEALEFLLSRMHSEFPGPKDNEVHVAELNGFASWSPRVSGALKPDYVGDISWIGN